MSIFWKILIGLVILYYGYVFWVLKIKKNKKSKKDIKKLGNLHLNYNIANNSDNEKIDLEDILNQVKEAENNSKLLDAFKKGSLEEEDSYSLTHKKHEKLKIIRDEGAADPNKTDTDS